MYAELVALKDIFDPQRLLTPGRVVEGPPIATNLRFGSGYRDRSGWTPRLDYEAEGGLDLAVERCFGAGLCKKTVGSMCPPAMVDRDEWLTTRARANALQAIVAGAVPLSSVGDREFEQVLGTCLACKACKSECPSSVDMAKLKAEFLQHYYDSRGTPLRARLIAAFPQLLGLAAHAPWAWNAVFGTPALRRLANRTAGFHPARTIPLLDKTTLRQWFARRPRQAHPAPNGCVAVFCDEFTDTFDVAIGIAAVELLEGLGYQVVIPNHVASGRSALSKGLLRQARALARRNVALLKDVVSAELPLIGIEPSAILAFRDEYPDLLRGDEKRAALELSRHCLMFDEWFVREMDAGHLPAEAFRECVRTVKLHGHCHQQALASLAPTVRMLERVPGQRVEVIPAACCGMAGAFGYESEHYDVANAIGELTLFPAVRAAGPEVLIAAPGTSCRHQILDGTGRRAQHPVELMRTALTVVCFSPRKC